MSITQNAILEKKNSLHRAPPPKAPVKKPSPSQDNKFQKRSDEPPAIANLIPSVKLRKTGFRDSLIAEDIDIKNTANAAEPTNELQSLMARRRAMFEHKEEEEVKPKPKLKPKPLKPAPENIKQKEDKENETKLRSDSGSDSTDQSKDILTDSNKNYIVCRDSRGEPKLCVLPTLESLGKPPPKCPKPENLTKLLENYDSNKIVMSTRRNTLSRLDNNSSFDHSIVEEEYEGEDYDDVDEDLKAQILGRNETEQEEQTTTEEGIMEENYDDVDEIKAKVEEINNAEAKSGEPITEENYDDLDTVAEQAREQLQNDFAVEGETFGEEMYDAVGTSFDGGPEVNEENASDSPIENKFPPSAISSTSKEKGKKDMKKEMENQKKKEREEQKKKKEEEKKREREEKEEKRRKEEEKKKRDRDDKELRKKHKLKPGTEGNGVGEAKRNFAGDGKFELPVKEGETLVIISENGCPQGKWLIKNPEGHLGYLPAELIQLKVDSQGNRISAIITEDFYEDVDQYQSATKIEEEEDDQEVYDDIAAGQEPIDEELYEELPADQ